MIELRSLNYFLIACEHENLSVAAQYAGIAPSTLSASVKGLENEFGVPLFRKHGTGLTPRLLAHWLYRASTPLMLLEAFARRRVLAPAAAPVERLRVEMHLRFAFGNLRRAINIALAATAEEEPLVMVDPDWPLETDAPIGKAGMETLGFDATTEMVIQAVARSHDLADGEVMLWEDPWMVVRREVGPGEAQVVSSLNSPNLMIPNFPTELVQAILEHSTAHGLDVQRVEAAPGDWPQLLDLHPGVGLLLPASAIGVRLGVSRVRSEPLVPPLSSTMIARTGNIPVAERFAQRLVQAFKQEGPAPQFQPVLTARRLRYFNLAYEMGRVSAASRAANIAQPALSQQLRILEDSLGVSLFERRSFGLVRRDPSVAFALASKLLDRRLRELELTGKTAAPIEGGKMSLGILPSVSQHGHLVNRITEALLTMRRLYPALRVIVRESPNVTLQNDVAQGRLGLAIVETVPAQMPRMALNASEPLAVIVDPRHALLPPGPVALADVGSSRVDLQACKLEYSIVSPK